MPLIVETGAGIPGAESYVSAADALTYHANRVNSSWAAADTATQEAKLREATAYVDGTYRRRWKGWRIEQALEWPRYEVTISGALQRNVSSGGFIGGAYLPYNQIPQRLKDAVCEAALRALSGPLLADLDQTVAREKVGTMETWYVAGAEVATTYPALDALLSGLLTSSGMGDVIR